MNRVFLVVCGMAFTIPGPVLAQTMTCTTIGNQTTCNQQPSFQPPPPIVPFDLGRALQARAAAQAAQAQADADPAAAANAEAARRAQDQKTALQTTVGHLIVEGDCDGATKAALNDGDIELATHVRAYCASQPKNWTQAAAFLSRICFH